LRANRSAEKMTLEEIVRIAKIAIGLGIARIKLTGGEPLMRKDLPEIVQGIAAVPGLKDLSLTTNGLLLDDMAKELRERGLKRVNISLPSLNAETYRKLTGGNLQKALAGVKAAVEAGFLSSQTQHGFIERYECGRCPRHDRVRKANRHCTATHRA